MAVTVTVTDSIAVARSISIDIGAMTPAPLVVDGSRPTPEIPAGGRVGEPIAPIDVAGVMKGGTRPYTYSLSNHPSWLKIDPVTGVISGTPTSTSEAATATVTITDATGESVSFQLQIGRVIVAKPAKVFPAGTLDFKRKRQYDVFKQAMADYGAPLRFESTKKFTVNADGSIKYKFAAIGKTTVTAYDGNTVVDTVEVKVCWTFFHWLLVIFLWGWIYL